MRRGLTLIELIISISIAALLGAAIVFMFRSGIDAYLFSENQALMQKIIDDTLEDISGEGFRSYGIKDAVEIIEAKKDSFKFSCLWIDESPPQGSKKGTYTLTQPYKLGSPIPVFESRATEKDKFTPVPITFVSGSQKDKEKVKDTVIVGESLPAGSEVRIIFEPESRISSGVVMSLIWSSEEGKFLRTYKDKTEAVLKNEYKEFKFTQAEFQYFDNTNTEIPSPVSEDLLTAVSAVRVNLVLEKGKGDEKRQGAAFINLRNTRSSGKGLTIRKGTSIKIPDSRNVRTFSIGNISGVKQGDQIQLTAQSLTRQKAWRITIRFGIKDNQPVIEGYSIDYPLGTTVYFEEINRTVDIPFNLMDIGKNGRYDYDFDEKGDNVVDLEGEVVLTVDEMTVPGAAVFIRP